MIKIAKIDETNWFQCTQLHVAETQKKIFTVPVVYWMAKCRYIDNHFENAIYNDDELIGFSVWGFDKENDEYWIAAIMIDEKYQNKGYGKQAVKELIKILSRNENCDKIFLGHRPNNLVASHFYEKMGFVDTGRREDGEIIRCLTLRK
ncbi:MAG: GNAT family N-acetyltransferase [Spirochaetales bacterium]|nr:GNAT family N-acetyltransferase [Spirochaetales bacterium]